MHRFGSEAELHSLRAEAMAAVARQCAPADASRAWRDLTDGRCSILDSFTTSHHSYLVITPAVLHAPVARRDLQMLTQVLSGVCPKQVAAELKLAQSTLAGALKQALERLGTECLPSKVPLGLVALMHSARGTGLHPQLSSSAARLLGVECEILTTPIPPLSNWLPRAVEEVALLHAAGMSHREIAELRGTSLCTIANQLATAFQRIGVSGRLGLLEFLLSRGQAPHQYGSTG